MTDNRRDMRIGLLLVALVAIVYAQVVRHEFISFDDGTYIYNNAMVQKGLTLQGIVWAFTTFTASNWHPITWLSHMLDCQLFGLNAGAHHAVNLLFHAANTLLLFDLLRRSTKATWESAIVAALFAVHPLHVEAVAWAAERKDVLSTFFAFLALGAYGRYTKSPSVRFYLLALVFFALGLMAKPMLVTLPFIMLLLDMWPFQRGDSTRSVVMKWGIRVVEKVPFFALSAALSVVTYMAQARGGAMEAITRSALDSRLENAFVSYGVYLIKTFAPLNLMLLYPPPAESLPPSQIWGALITLGIVTIVANIFLSDRPYLAVGWYWFLGALVPVIGLVQVGTHATADRYTYLPHAGLFIMIVWGLSGALAQRQTARKWALGVAVIVCTAYLSLAFVQTSRWKDNTSLFTYAVEKSPENSRMRNHLGMALVESGDVDGAEKQFLEAIEISPQDVSPINNLAGLYLRQERPEEAFPYLLRAIAYRPMDPTAHLNLAIGQLQRGRITEARAQAEYSLELNPASESTQEFLKMLNEIEPPE